MDLTWSDEQQALREAVRDLCAKHGGPDELRELEDDPVGYRPAFWQELAQMDLLGLGLPPEHGGSGMGLLEQCIVAEELGRSIVPSPWFPTVAVAAPLLVRAGDEAQQGTWLPRIARGEAVLTIAWHEPAASETAAGIRARAERDGDGFVLHGTKVLVPFASSADALLVLARTGEAEREVGLFLVPADTPGLAVEQTPSLAADAQFQVLLDGVRVGSEALVGAADGGWDAFEDVMADALLLASAHALGGAERTLEMTADYAKERVQFGVPIGNFQGIAHPIADRATEVEATRTMVQYAAWLADGGTRSLPLAAMTKRFASESWRLATRTGQQTFGGIGFTRAIDVQLYFRRAKQWELSWFGPAALDAWVAEAELDAPRPLVGHDLGA